MWRRKGLFHLIGKIQSIMKVNEGRNMEAWTDTETMEEWYLLACSHGLPSLLSYRTQDQKWHWDPCGALSSQSLNKKSAPTDQSDGGEFPAEVLEWNGDMACPSVNPKILRRKITDPNHHGQIN